MKSSFYSFASIMLAVIILAGFGCNKASDSGAFSPNVKEMWEKFPTPWAEKEAREAADFAKSMMKDNPDDIALELYYQDRMIDADIAAVRSEYSSRMDEFPSDPMAKLLYARVSSRRLELGDIIDEAIALAPDNPFVQALGSYEYTRRQIKNEEALKSAEEALVLSPHLPLAHFATGAAYLESGNREKALHHAGQACEGNTHKFDYFNLMVKATEFEQDQTGETETNETMNKVVDILEGYLKNNPGHPSAVRSLSSRYRITGNMAGVVELQRSSALINPEDGWAYFDLANLCAEVNQPDSCLHYLKMAIELGYYDYDLLQEQTEDSQNPFYLLHHYSQAAKNIDGGKEKKFHASDLISKDSSVIRRVANGYSDIIKMMKTKQVVTQAKRKKEALENLLDFEAPLFSLENDKGNTVNMADLKGDIVILDFWATWCPPCKLSIPRLRALHQDKVSNNPNIHLFGMNVWERVTGEERKTKVRETLKEENVTWQILYGDKDIAKEYDVMGIPTFLVIDKEGIIRYKLVGYHAFLDETLVWMVDSLI